MNIFFATFAVANVSQYLVSRLSEQNYSYEVLEMLPSNESSDASSILLGYRGVDESVVLDSKDDIITMCAAREDFRYVSFNYVDYAARIKSMYSQYDPHSETFGSWLMNQDRIYPSYSCFLIDFNINMLWLMGDAALTNPIWYSIVNSAHQARGTDRCNRGADITITTDLLLAHSTSKPLNSFTAVGGGQIFSFDLCTSEVEFQGHFQLHKGKWRNDHLLEHYAPGIFSASLHAISNAMEESVTGDLVVAVEVDPLEASSELLDCATDALLSTSNPSRDSSADGHSQVKLHKLRVEASITSPYESHEDLGTEFVKDLIGISPSLSPLLPCSMQLHNSLQRQALLATSGAPTTSAGTVMQSSQDFEPLIHSTNQSPANSGREMESLSCSSRLLFLIKECDAL